ncbi:MAG TPA: hypothetical protein VIR54_08280 [Vicinamibacterales bacterium]
MSTHRAARARRPSWKRRILIAAGASAATVCLLVVLALIALHTPPIQRLVASRILDMLERQQLAVSAQQFRYNLLDGSVSLQQVRIGSTQWRDGPPFITIGRARVVVNLLQLLRGLTAGATGDGFAAETSGPAYDAARAALSTAWGGDTIRVATGGSIPLVHALSTGVPDAEILLLGATDGFSNIHAPNERVLVKELRNTVLAQALFFHEYADRWSSTSKR